MKKSAALLCVFALSVSAVHADELSDLRQRVETLEKRLSAPPAPAVSGGWTAGYKEGGGGFYVASADSAFMLRILGYVQANFNYFDDKDAEIRQTAAGPGTRRISNDFSIRRARMDWLATLHSNTEFFVEFDGGPGTASPSASANQSDFALVEARLTQKFCDAFYLRLGKYTTPFSSENFRSSRAIDTVERYAALNSLFGLPATDVQMGAMIFGNLAANKLTYYVGAFNGNGRANDNFRDNNSQKEVQLKLAARPWEGTSSGFAKASFGLGVDMDRELAQTLAIATLGGTRLASFGVRGQRTGYSADFFLPVSKLELRGEGVTVNFEDDATNLDADLYGGFVQASYEVWSGQNGASFAPIVRAETAVINNGTGGSARLNILTVGWNAWLNKNVRWQLNYVPHSFDFNGAGVTPTSQPDHFDEVFSQIQFKI